MIHDLERSLFLELGIELRVVIGELEILVASHCDDSIEASTYLPCELGHSVTEDMCTSVRDARDSLGLTVVELDRAVVERRTFDVKDEVVSWLAER